MKVYGQNGNADALNSIRDGFMTATSWEDCYGEGLAAIEAIEKILADKEGFEQGAYEMPAAVITADNIEDFIAEHPEVIENVQ